MAKPLHLIQTVGFSLPNIVCALAHDRINSATLLYTSEIPEEHIHRAIEIANECRNSPLSPHPNLIRIPSPDADATEQFNAIQKISMPPSSEVVVGVTGGTQRVMGTLVARFGTDRLLWVSNEPKVVLQIGKKRWFEELELEIDDFQRLYGLENNPVPTDRTSISNGRLSFSKNISFRPFPKLASVGKRRSWARLARVSISDVAKEIVALEKKFGRIQFRYNLNVTVEDDVTRERIVPILGRLPKSVNINIDGKRLVDPIESIAVESIITQGHLRTGIYELLKTHPPLQDSATLHLLVGKYNSIPVANAIVNHRPSRICLWALNHRDNKSEIQLLCNQVFTIKGWIEGSLDKEMGVGKLIYGQSPKCVNPPDETLFMNTSVDGIEALLEELYKKNNLGDAIIDVSSGSGQISSLLIKAISDFSPNPTITYTHPWTGDITNLSTGKLDSGTGLPIVDRLWLSQRPVIRYEESVILNQEGAELLHEIAERARDTADDSISPRAGGGKTSHTLPRESWGDISVKQLTKRPKMPERIEYRRGDAALEFQMPTRSETAGYWIDDMMRYAIPHHFQPLDCITSVGIMTQRKERLLLDIEIDAIFMMEDGLTFVSCKRGKEAWNIKAFKETLSWETLVGGPNSKSIIVHSNMFNPDTESGNALWMKNDRPTINYLHWFDLLGVEFEMLNPKEEEE